MKKDIGVVVGLGIEPGDPRAPAVSRMGNVLCVFVHAQAFSSLSHRRSLLGVPAVLWRKADNFSAATLVTIGSLAVLWIALSGYFPDEWASLKNSFHPFMAVIPGGDNDPSGGRDS